MRKVTLGILAHVDAGKTTLSESMLYLSGKIRRIGRVDNRDAYLDTYELEKLRGITIFSKQAIMQFDDTEITLLDTPGHVDFSAEMERTLQVLDYAILVISGADGVQNHTKTLWELLEIYDIPTFIFVNKMDQMGTDREFILNSLGNELSDRCIEFDTKEDQSEMLALCDDNVMENYIEDGFVADADIRYLITERKIFPVYFGSALKQIGTEVFIKGFLNYAQEKTYPSEFGAKVFKISRDPQGNRLTHMKITGGLLKVKDIIETEEIQEKINQIRIYSGDKFSTENELGPGSVCAVTGLFLTRAGEGLGSEEESKPPQLEPVLSYQVILSDELLERQLLPMLRELEEEEPELRVLWNEVHQSIHIQVMGLVQLEILQSIIKERFDIDVSYGQGEIVYKETITTICEGVGHFEPLRHYSEVHLLLEPGERGSGMVFISKCSEDILGKNWQNLVVKHLNEKAHIGVLTGSYVTDMKVTLVSGRAHNKHTVGGDFREATFRALRQGLMEAESVLLEPYYKFSLELPENLVGRAMTDIDKMYGSCTIDNTNGEVALIIGDAPVSTMQNYQQDVHAYTKGEGRLSIAVKGYDICHNSDEIIDRAAYEAELDELNPTGSVFCNKGSGFHVPWYEVKDSMHVESFLKLERSEVSDEIILAKSSYDDNLISLEEIDAIINSTQYANQGRKNVWKKQTSAKESYYSSLSSSRIYSGSSINTTSEEKYLLVDGYNIIHAWPELEQLAKDSLEASRAKLMDILSNYQSILKYKIILVFDAYRVKAGNESVEDYHNIQVVFTAEAQTADHFIEKFAHKNKEKFQITVATSDGLEQMIIRGAGARVLSARDLREAVYLAEEELRRDHLSVSKKTASKLEDVLSEDVKDKLKSGITK
ncbi:MAG: translation factor GTPase family protein [Acidaminobacteraceae bacterium]